MDKEEQFVQLNDSLETMAAMMLGYKAKLMAGGEGFTEESAEYMVCQFHELMMHRMIEIEEE